MAMAAASVAVDMPEKARSGAAAAELGAGLLAMPALALVLCPKAPSRMLAAEVREK